MSMYTKKDLIDIYRKGKKLKYLFFWKIEKSGNTIDKNCLSQWYPTGFTLSNTYYPTAEHYMMAQKAQLFDKEMVKHILDAKTTKEVKILGRNIKNFDENVWQDKSLKIVLDGNLAKFSQNVLLKDFLLSTSKKVLIEASPYDKIWGIGLDESSDHIKNPLFWKGDNKLGFVLMKVRDILQNN